MSFGMANTRASGRRRSAKTSKKAIGRPRLSSRTRTRKVTVSLTPDRIQAIRRAVAAGRAESISAYVSEAIDQHAERDTLSALLDELDAELGPPTPDAEAWADAALARFDARLAPRGRGRA
jgi:Arc/MetJ-type ribon-helix-helix transcriptional regulator